MTRWRHISPVIVTLPLAACTASAPNVSHSAPAVTHSALAVTRGTPAASLRGMVTGTFTLEGGPVRPGGQQPGKRPIPGTIQFARSDHRLITTRAGHSGTFSIRLQAGTYRVSGRSPRVILGNGAGREFACSLPVTVAVIPGRTMHISLVCIVP